MSSSISWTAWSVKAASLLAGDVWASIYSMNEKHMPKVYSHRAWTPRSELFARFASTVKAAR